MMVMAALLTRACLWPGGKRPRTRLVRIHHGTPDMSMCSSLSPAGPEDRRRQYESCADTPGRTPVGCWRLWSCCIVSTRACCGPVGWGEREVAMGDEMSEGQGPRMKGWGLPGTGVGLVVVGREGPDCVHPRTSGSATPIRGSLSSCGAPSNVGHGPKVCIRRTRQNSSSLRRCRRRKSEGPGSSRHHLYLAGSRLELLVGGAG